MLATSLPVISESKLEYTISLRRGLRFPDGSEFTADDVKWSIERARSLGNFLGQWLPQRQQRRWLCR